MKEANKNLLKKNIFSSVQNVHMFHAFQLRSDVLKAHFIGIMEVDLSTSTIRQVNGILPYSDVCWLMMPGVVFLQVGMVLETTMRTKSLEIDA